MVQLDSFESFERTPAVQEVMATYRNQDMILYTDACETAYRDLCEYNVRYAEEHDGRFTFTHVDRRPKTPESLLKKLYALTLKRRDLGGGVDRDVVHECYMEIKDKAGARVSCPYYDDIYRAIEEVIRVGLANKGYGVNLGNTDPGLRDRDWLDQGDGESGYRAYHLYLKVPTRTDIWGTIDLVLCELQLRSELQHVWAVKSHDLVYKIDEWDFSDPNVVGDMKAVSNSLRAADQNLQSIRDRLQN